MFVLFEYEEHFNTLRQIRQRKYLDLFLDICSLNINLFVVQYYLAKENIFTFRIKKQYRRICKNGPIDSS